jgi:hypothetical protein
MQVGANGSEEQFDIPFDSNGYIYEVREVHDCLRAGQIESDALTFKHSLGIMEMMDEMRAQWGLKYPEE